jgi:putative membrane protein
MTSLLQQEIQSGTDPDVKAFAQKTLPVIQEHLRMAQQLQGQG